METQTIDQPQNQHRAENKLIYDFKSILIVGIIGHILLGFVVFGLYTADLTFILGIIYFVVMMVLIGDHERIQMSHALDHFQNQQRKAKINIYLFLKILLVGIVVYFFYLFYGTFNHSGYGEIIFILGIDYFLVLVVLFDYRKRIQIPQTLDKSQNQHRRIRRIIYLLLKIIVAGIVGCLFFLLYYDFFDWGNAEVGHFLGKDYFLIVLVVIIGDRERIQVSQVLIQSQNQERRESKFIYLFLKILFAGIIEYFLILLYHNFYYYRLEEVGFILGIIFFTVMMLIIRYRERIQIHQIQNQSQNQDRGERKIIYLFLKILFAGIVGFLLFLLSLVLYYSGLPELAFILLIITCLIMGVLIGYRKRIQIPLTPSQSQHQRQSVKKYIYLILKILLAGSAVFLFVLLIQTGAPGVVIILAIILCVGVGFLLGYRKRIQISLRKRTAKRRISRSLRYAKAAQMQEELQDFPSARKKWQNAEKLLLKTSKKFPDYVTREYLIQNVGVIKKKIGITYISQGIQIQQDGWKHVQKGDLKKAKKYYYNAITIVEDAVRFIHNAELQDNSFTFPISFDLLNEIIRFYRQNSSYFQNEKNRKKSTKNAQNIVDLSEFHQKIHEAVQEFNHVLWIYDQALRTMQSSPTIEEISSLIEQKISKILNLLSNVQERTQILYNYTRSMGKSDSVTKLTSESFTLPSLTSIPPVDLETVETQQMKLIREYEFIGGRIRFKVGLQNQTGKVMTNLAFRFDLPDSLIWVLHEPNYLRRGDTIHIPKLGGHEKLAISFYFEPINCLDSVINATLTYFDPDDHPNALVMPSKSVSVSCPIFFTREDANLARVKNLSLELKIKDRKVFPLSNSVHAEVIFNKLLETVGKHDVKLVSSEFEPTTRNGEAWFYGVTKIKLQKMVIWIFLDPSHYALELTVWGDDQEQITGLLAELEGQLRQSLLLNHIIDDSKKFNEISTSILLGNCPYCAAPIASEPLQRYKRGETIQCKYCDKSLAPY